MNIITEYETEFVQVRVIQMEPDDKMLLERMHNKHTVSIPSVVLREWSLVRDASRLSAALHLAKRLLQPKPAGPCTMARCFYN
jgi:hypothetical protein